MNEYFTPMTGAAGGSMIGLAAVVVLIFNGNILGASGILSHVVDAPHKALQDTSQFWRLVLLSTFLLTSTFLLGPQYATDDRIMRGDTSVPIPSQLGYAVAGLLVGFGSKLGNGCTSGMYQGKAELFPIELSNHNEPCLTMSLLHSLRSWCVRSWSTKQTFLCRCYNLYDNSYLDFHFEFS